MFDPVYIFKYFISRMDSNFVKLTVRAQYKFKASNNDEASFSKFKSYFRIKSYFEIESNFELNKLF